MQILHLKAALNRPPRILHSENANYALKIEILCSNIEILRSENVKFCSQKLQWCPKQTGQNSALRKWKFCTQKMENFPNAMESLLFRDFLCQIGKFHTIVPKSIFCAKFYDCGILEGLRLYIFFNSNPAITW